MEEKSSERKNNKKAKVVEEVDLLRSLFLHIDFDNARENKNNFKGVA